MLIHAFLSAAKRLPLDVFVIRSARRCGVDTPWLRRLDFFRSPDARRPTKGFEILARAMEQAGLDVDTFRSAIPMSRVLEVGCGRYGGFAPLVTMLGAARYSGIDPSLDLRLLQHPRIRSGYLESALRKCAVEAGAVDIDDPIARFDEICEFHECGLGPEIVSDSKADISLSISCLEHIMDFDIAAASLARLTGSTTAHFHVVNFSNHLDKAKPFHHLYDLDNKTFQKRFPGVVNGMRLPDIIDALAKVGIRLHPVHIESRSDRLPDKIHPYWTDRYDEETLAIRTALLCSQALD